MRPVVVVVALAGCMPYAVPPVTGDIGAIRTTDRGARTGVHVDVGFAPMQLVESQLHRRWDATVSGTFERTANNDDAWGVAAAAGPIVFPWGDDPARSSVSRFSPQVVGRWTTSGTAVGLRFALERASFARGSSSGGGNGSSAFGEGAYGIYVEADYRRADDDDGDGWAVTGGLTFRIPALAGVACCFH